MANESFNRGAVYVRDYILASLLGLQNGLYHTDPDNPEYEAYQKVYDLITNKFGDMFEPFQS